jgi:hypothetical protein
VRTLSAGFFAVLEFDAIGDLESLSERRVMLQIHYVKRFVRMRAGWQTAWIKSSHDHSPLTLPTTDHSDLKSRTGKK